MNVSKEFITEDDFWKQFVDLLNAFTPKKKRLTEKEVDILAVCLNFNVETKYPFKGIKRKQIKDKLGLAEQTLAMHKKNMEEKGWINNGVLNRQLQAMFEYVKGMDKIDFVMTIKLKVDEPLRDSEITIPRI